MGEDLPTLNQGTHEQALNQLKRRVYLTGLMLAAFAALMGQVLNPAPQDLGDDLILPSFSLTSAVCALLLWRNPATLRMVERVLFGAVVALFTLNTYRNLELASLMREGIWLTALWGGLIYIYVYAVFDIRRSWYVSVGYFGAQVLVGMIALLPGVLAGGSLQPVLSPLLQFYFSQLGFLLVARLVIAYEERVVRFQHQAETLYQLAHSDPLTGIMNRRFLYSEIAQALTRSQRQNTPLALILLDIDGFKRINDTFGHEVGDRVLIRAASRFQTAIRHTDHLGRWGGEEFIVLLPETRLEEAVQIANRLRDALSETPLDGMLRVTASIGLTEFRSGDSLNDLVSRADQAMYDAKRSGGDGVRPWTPALLPN